MADAPKRTHRGKGSKGELMSGITPRMNSIQVRDCRDKAAAISPDHQRLIKLMDEGSVEHHQNGNLNVSEARRITGWSLKKILSIVSDIQEIFKQ